MSTHGRKHPKPPSFRRRVLLALGLSAAVPTVLLLILVGTFGEVLEHELAEHILEEETEELEALWRLNPELRLPTSMSHHVLPVSEDELPALVPSLRDLPEGVHGQVMFEGREYYAGWVPVSGGRVYLLVSTQPLEVFEARIMQGLMAVIVLSMVLLLALDYLMARSLTDRLARLSRTVSLAAGQNPAEPLDTPPLPVELQPVIEAVETLRQRLQEQLQRERAFSEDAGHELRTPLTAALNACELLRAQDGLDAGTRERVQRIERACHQMHETLDVLMRLAREEPLGPLQDCALDQLLAEQLDMIEPRFAARGMRLVRRIEPVRMQVPAAMVSSIMSNLLSNALAHSGGDRVEVVLDRHEFCVLDNGPGMAVQDVERAFERGHRGADSGGRGLGLHLVRRLCERLGWQVSLHNAAAGGVCCRVRLGERSAPGPGPDEILTPD